MTYTQPSSQENTLKKTFNYHFQTKISIFEN